MPGRPRGSRYLIALAAGRDLTGIVVEDYGCASVMVTGDPFVTPAGEATQPGTVSGYLDGPVALLADLGVGNGR